jgi:integrative and conjugative element protein (TIGR02256 family)
MTTVVMSRVAASELADHAGASSDGRETGGILVGRDEGLGGNILLMRCGDAGPTAIRKKNRFSRDVAHAQDLVDEARIHDGSTWIGEWHTHLMDLATPSKQDLRTYRRLLNDPDTYLTRLIALIVLRGDQLGWSAPMLYAWSYTGSVLRQLPVEIAEPGESP